MNQKDFKEKCLYWENIINILSKSFDVTKEEAGSMVISEFGKYLSNSQIVRRWF